MAADDQSFDLAAAGLRSDGRDVVTFVELLAGKLEAALPADTVVRRRKKGLFSGARAVESIAVALGEHRYELALHGRRVEATRAREVRSIVIKREPLELDAWVLELTRQLQAEAAESERARTAFERLVG